MSSLLASILKDSLLEVTEAGADSSTQLILMHDDEGHGCDLSDPTRNCTPSITAALRLIESNQHVILQYGDDGIPNIFFALHSYPVVDAILSRYPDEASTTKESRLEESPLHAACQVPNVSVDIIRLLLAHCPELAVRKTKEGKTALHVAAANSTASDQVIALLIQVNKEALWTQEFKNSSLPLHYACAFRAPLATIEVLIKHFKDAVTLFDKQDRAPLHLAILYKCDQDVIGKLLEDYPDAIRLPDGKGRLPLHLALIASNTDDIINFLLQRYPAAVEIEAPDGVRVKKKPIHYAIRQKASAGVVNLLLRASYDQRVDVSICGDSLLHSALEFSSSMEIVQAIISTQPQAVHELNADGKLPIHFAAWHQSPHEIISLLIQLFPDSVKTREEKCGNLPIHYAIQYAPQGPSADIRPSLVLLEAYPAAVFEANSKGFFPIHLAARNRCPVAFIDALLKICPYSVGFQDKDPKSQLLALDFALRMNANADVISRLLGIEPQETVSHALEHVREERDKKGQSMTGSVLEILENGEKDEGDKPKGLKDALLGLQEKFAQQGEELRNLRRKMEKQTKILQERIAEIKGLKHDVTWRDDRVKILERELDALKKEMKTLM